MSDTNSYVHNIADWTTRGSKWDKPYGAPKYKSPEFMTFEQKQAAAAAKKPASKKYGGKSRRLKRKTRKTKRRSYR